MVCDRSNDGSVIEAASFEGDDVDDVGGEGDWVDDDSDGDAEEEDGDEVVGKPFASDTCC